MSHKCRRRIISADACALGGAVQGPWRLFNSAIKMPVFRGLPFAPVALFSMAASLILCAQHRVAKITGGLTLLKLTCRKHKGVRYQAHPQIGQAINIVLLVKFHFHFRPIKCTRHPNRDSTIFSRHCRF